MGTPTTQEPELSDLVAQSRALEVKGKDGYRVAIEMVRALRAMRERVKGTFDAPKAAAHATHKAIIAAEKPFHDALNAAEEALLERLVLFVAAAEFAAGVKTAESRVIMLKDAEADRVRTATDLIADGHREEALALFDAPLRIADPTWAPEIPKVPGVAIRHSWRAELVDLDALIAWANEERRVPELFKPDDKELDRLARELAPKGEAVPGLRFVPTVTLAISEKK